ncbi:MAG: M1 family aminopeptidase [Anaeromyxobacteraceae bacterium]
MRAPACLASALLLSACPGSKHRPTAECAYTTPGPRAYDALAYDVAGRLDWTTGALSAKETLTLGLCEGAAASLELDVPPVVLSVKVAGKVTAFTRDTPAQTLTVPVPGEAGDTVQLEVEYVAPAAGGGLLFTREGAGAGDPLKTALVMTASEPRLGHTWMVENDEPADRARFSFSLEVPDGVDLVANGERVLDEPVSSGGRRIGYAMDRPIPPYVMAFAAGALDRRVRTHASPSGERYPVALWWRSGLLLDVDAYLDLVESQLTGIERLLGPYPWKSYAVVLVPTPPYGQGMENVGITFIGELWATGDPWEQLHAHELAHQWAGDWVTIRTPDDLFVKEGFATLLGFEAERAGRDRAGLGRFLGSEFRFAAGDAIVDPSLRGVEKYGNGPYRRAAYLLSQLRVLLGEDTFWSTWRAFLAAHADGSARGEDLVQAFAPHLDAATLERVREQLTVKGLPLVSSWGLGSTRAFTFTAPGGELAPLVPHAVTVVDAQGTARWVELPAGIETVVEVPPGGYLAPDESGLYPYPPLPPAGLEAILVPPPGSPYALAAFLARSAAHQELALSRTTLGLADPLLARPDPRRAGFVAGAGAPPLVRLQATRGGTGLAGRAMGRPAAAAPRALRVRLLGLRRRRARGTVLGGARGARRAAGADRPDAPRVPPLLPVRRRRRGCGHARAIVSSHPAPRCLRERQGEDALTDHLKLSLVVLTLLAACGEREEFPGAATEDCRRTVPGARAYDALSYALAGRFDRTPVPPATTGMLEVDETITLALCKGVTSSIELDAPAGVTSVSSGGSALGFTPSGPTLKVELGKLAGSRDPITLAVHYRTPESGGLAQTTSTPNDPVRSWVVFTDSEPRQGHLWMVEKDDPADRATFSVTLDVLADEDVVANGERVLDQALPSGGRRVGYAIDVPLPTYLMAFAAGELEHVERTYVSAVAGGKPVPLALWYRRGLAVDAAGNLDDVEEAMARFEALLGPYRFSRYSVVLLPAPFGGGMENATITFDAESGHLGWRNFSLSAHELAHHWFGDWVTMRAYDDVWVKEGMATLLAAEAQRGSRDRSASGRLFGIDFAFNPDHAIVDPSLVGLQKYTTGPYQRSATLITQVRARVGEAAFWASLRAFLDAHAHDSATGEDFLRAFAPALGEADLQKALAELTVKGAPGDGATRADVASGVQLSFTPTGSAGAFIAPLSATRVSASGVADAVPLAPGSTGSVLVEPGGYAALDEREASSHTDADAAIAGALAPDDVSRGSLAPFLSRSAGHQERALLRTIPSMQPADLAGFLAGLDSDYARRYALRRACARWSSGGDAWRAALVATLGAAPVPRYDSTLYTLCGASIGAAFESELVALEAAPVASALPRLEYLLSFQTGAQGRAALTHLAANAPTLELRDLATARLQLGPALRAGEAPAAGAPDTAADEGKAGRSPTGTVR